MDRFPLFSSHEETMNLSPTTQTAAPALAQATIPIQTEPVYHCFTCGAPALGLRTWADLPKWDGYSPLDAWGEHIAYLTLPACPPNHIHRVARLGDCITPLTFIQHTARGEWQKTIAANIQAIRDALAALAAALSESERDNDAAVNIVLNLMAGLMPPSAAIDQIRQLVARHTNEEGPAHA